MVASSTQSNQSHKKLASSISQAPQSSTQGGGEYSMTERNVLICKTLLNIAHCLSHILDVKSWYIVLETM